MPSSSINRILIAGTGSGCGKTTVTCGLLKALMNKGYKVASFKCGPDYIDPMFHSTVIGTPSRNLDSFLCGEETVRYLFAKNSREYDLSVVEGVMGFYDGLGVRELRYSSCDLSNSTDTPVILIVNARGMSLSISAVIQGFLHFSINNIQGVILNNTHAAMFPALKESIEAHTGIQVLGYMPNLPEASIESRHLGLVTAAEIDSLSQKVDMLADCAGRTIDLEAIIAIAQSAPPLSFTTPKIEKGRPVRIALAKDRAFCFIYQDSIDLLAEMGAEIVPFSPLTDACLPSHMDGILLYGGYPELYAEELSRNTSMRNSIRQAISQGIPTYAECGGFMYLGTSIRDTEGKDYPMVGAFDNRSELTDRLQNFGYVELTAQEDTLLCYKGDQIHAHEFHYAKSDDNGNAFIAVKTSNGKENRCILSRGTVFGGYPHLHFWGNPRFAAGFLSKCRQFSESRF